LSFGNSKPSKVLSESMVLEFLEFELKDITVSFIPEWALT
jgi:hypothetical protein